MELIEEKKNLILEFRGIKNNKRESRSSKTSILMEEILERLEADALKVRRKKLIKPLALLLSVVMLMSTLVGCGDEEVRENIVPEVRLFEDEYPRNAEITDTLSYSIDYMSNEKNDDMSMLMLFDHMKVQVDDWDNITIGISTMKEVAAIVDKSNENYVSTKTQAIIDERQKEIDAEYEKEKAKAEAKGKEYTKKKKEVRTDDIHYENPYTYTVWLDDDLSNCEYEPTRLIDPGTYAEVYFDVAKYGVPYVRFSFMSEMNYNAGIKQEADWVLNGISAANVSEYQTFDEDGVLIDSQDFVDSDLLNKAAKKNMFMSGNIAFGGEGFTWDSLMLLCDALQLEEGVREHGYEQSSDDNFTYYTMTFATNVMEDNQNIVLDERTEFPITRLVATFDPLTQVCLNWTIDTYTDTVRAEDEIHSISEKMQTNVHQYQVDTNNYVAMKKSVEAWVEANALETKTAYCALTNDEKNPIAGVVETGTKNLTLEPVVDGVSYTCLTSKENEDGSVTGTYAKLEEWKNAEAAGDTTEVTKNAQTWTIRPCVLDKDNNVIGYFNKNENTMINGETTYYVVDYEETDEGVKDVKLLAANQLESLLSVYIKTYQLTNAETEKVNEIYATGGIFAVRDHMYETFKAAEDTKENEQEEVGTFYELEKNTESDFSNIKYGEQTFNINTMKTNDLESIGFAKTDSVFSMSSKLITSNGDVYKNTDNVEVKVEAIENGTVKSIVIENNMIDVNGVKVGMTKDEVVTALNLKAEDVENGGVVLKGEENALIIYFDETESTVKTIHVVGKVGMGSPIKEGSEIIDDEKETEEEDLTLQLGKGLYKIEKNTDKDVSKIKLGDKELDVKTLTEESLNAFGFNKTDEPFSFYSNLVNASGYIYENADKLTMNVEINDTDEFESVSVEDPSFECFNGLKIGMTKEEAFKAVELDNLNKDDSEIVLMGEKDALIVSFDIFEDTVASIHILNEKALVPPETEEELPETQEQEIPEEQKEEDPTETTNEGAVVVIVVAVLIGIAAVVFTLLCMWKIFVKMDEAGWKALIPIYNIWIMYKNVFDSPLLPMVTLLIPVVGQIFSFIALFKLYKKFEKSTLFSVIGLFVSPICLAICAFGKNEFDGETIVVEDTGTKEFK